MSQSMCDCGIKGWLGMALMSCAEVLVVVLLLLALLALARHLFMGAQHASVR